MAKRPLLQLLSSRGLRLFVGGPATRNRSWAWGVVVTLVAAISTVDYLAGIELSLSIFYLIPVSLATGWLGARAGVVVACASTSVRLAGDIITVHPAPLPGHTWWNVVAAFVICLFVIWLVDTLVSAHHALEGRIAERTSQLAASIADRRRLEIEVLDISARERAAIGRELHDELGQHLVATALASQVLAQQLGTERGGKEAQAIVRWIEDAIAKTRKLARGLLLARIEADRFVGELEELASSACHGGVRCRVVHQGGVPRASDSQCAQLFRVAQEAVGNALRHARPSTIEITLATDVDSACLIIADDGAGYPAGKVTSGMGLRIMQHRARIIGASLTVLSAPGEGTKVICRLPTSPAPS